MSAHARFLPLVLGLALLSCPPSFADPLDRHGDPLPPGAVARLGTLRLSYDGNQESVALSPDGKLVATVDAFAKSVQLWDAATSRSLHRFPVAGDFAPSLPVFSADSKQLAVAVNIDLLVWDVTTRKEVRRFRAEAVPTGGLVFIGATTLAASCNGGRVHWWDLATGKTLQQWDGLARAGHGGHPLKGRLVPFASPDGRTVAGHVRIFPGEKAGPNAQSGEQYFVAAWDAVGDKELWRSADAGSFAGPLTFSSDGKLLASVGSGGEVTVREAATGKLVRRLQGEPFGPVWPTFSADGRLLAAGWPGWSVWLWDVRSGKRLHYFAAYDGKGNKQPAPQVALSGDGKRLAVGTGVSVRLFDTITGRETLTFEGHREAVETLAFSADGRSLHSTSAETTCGWDTANWKETRRVPVKTLSRARNVSLVLERGAYFADGEEGNLCLFDLGSGKVRQRLAFQGGSDRRVLSGDGKVIVVVQRDDVGDRVVVLDAATGKELACKEPHKKVDWFAAPHAGLIAWTSPDDLFGQHLYLWDGKGKVRVPDKEGTEAQQERWAGVGDWRLLFSPDGRHLAVTDTSRVPCGLDVPVPRAFASLYEVATNRKPEGLAIPREVLGWAFAPDGRTLATTHAPGGIGFLGVQDRTTVCLWEVVTGQLRAKLVGHTQAVNCVAFSPGGRLLASGSGDGTVLVWDLMRLPRPEK